MAKTKTKTAKVTPIESIRVRYDLHDLPTAQHKAGLAGLLLQIESMATRREHGLLDEAMPVVSVIEKDKSSATFEFTAENVQALFDDLYAANFEEAKVKAKWAGAELKRMEDVEVKDDVGKTKIEKRFVYDIVKPAGLFLKQHTDGGREAWHKLWQDMLWNVLRGKPTTRIPYNDRAAGKTTKDGDEVWTDLVANEKNIKKTGGPKTIGVGGAILIGAQAVNAEAVAFLDRADHALLLHFWHLVARIFVPEQIDKDGKSDFVGYTLAVPEVSDLKQFNRVFVRALTELGDKKRGYRPADAVIALPSQGSLEFMRQLMTVTERTADAVLPSRYLNSIEFFYLVKLGNNIKIAATGRVPPRDALLQIYNNLRTECRNPLMLAGRLKALLDGRPWFADLADDLVEREWSWFVHSQKEGHRTPLAMISFAYDTYSTFKLLQQKDRDMSQGDSPPRNSAVDLIVHRIIEEYVVQKARGRLGVKADAPRKGPETHFLAPPKADRPEQWLEKSEFKEQRQHAATDLMLRLRSRHAEDFVEQFTLSVSPVAHYLPAEDYAVLAAALMLQFTNETGENRPRTRDDVKSLTLLALSAASRSLMTRTDNHNTEAGDAGEKSQS